MNTSDICRLCLTVCLEKMCLLSEKCEIMTIIQSSLSVRILIDEDLPNQVCLNCQQKIEEIYCFYKKVTENQKALHQYLNDGKDCLKKFYADLIKQKEIKTESEAVLDNKENEVINICVQNTEYNSVQLKEELKSNVLQNDNSFEFSSDDDIALSSLKTNENLTAENKNTTKHLKKNSLAHSKENSTVDSDKLNVDENFTQNPTKHKCLTCFELFSTQNELLKHYNSAHGHKKSIETKNNEIQYVVVTVDNKTAFKCRICDKEYDNKRGVKKHVACHNGNRPFNCKMCGRTYKTASEIIRHGRAHSGFKLECTYKCGYSTVYLGALKEHERRHRTEFKYKCEKCNKGFQVKTWYEEHQNIHNGVKPFICSICGLSFHMNRYLTAHRSAVHPQSSSLKRYVCMHCSLPCDTRKTLTEHLKEHGIKNSFLCDMCGKTLSNSEQLKFHKRMHLGVKPFTCSTCNKSFCKKFNLKIHERTHTGERAHVCVRCGKRYTQRSALLRHHARNHPTSPQRSTKCHQRLSSTN